MVCQVRLELRQPDFDLLAPRAGEVFKIAVEGRIQARYLADARKHAIGSFSVQGNRP
jgi:hypothetical protein